MQIESLQYKKSLIGCSSDSKLIICIRVMEPLLRIADNQQLRDDTHCLLILRWEIDQCDFPSRRVSVTRKEYGMSRYPRENHDVVSVCRVPVYRP